MKTRVVQGKIQIGIVLLVLLGATAWGQQDSTQTPAAPAPAPAFGQEPPPPQVTLAPPVTSLDEMSLEPAIAVRSYLLPGIHVGESVNSNLSNRGSANGTVGITRLLGSLDLTRLWSRFAFSADYVGGVALYSNDWSGPSQTQAASLGQRYAWRTGQVQLHDCLTVLPEGSFGFSGFNGAGSGAMAGGVSGCQGFGGGSNFGSLGNNPRLTNVSSIDIRESLNPRSSITAAGAYSFTDFLSGTAQSQGAINTRQESGQVGYSHVLNHFDQLGLQYGFDQFQFPTKGAGKIDSQTVQVLYEHAISGRMQLILGAGPQWVTLHPPSASTTTKLNASVHAVLQYRFPRDTVALSYNRHTTAGSGIQLGSQTDDARATFSRPLSRLWTGSLDGGYSHHTALQPAVGNAIGGSYQAGFGGGGLTRRLGRFFSLQMHYQYTYEFFNSAQIANGNFGRHIGDITLSWHPAPIRLD